MDTAFNVLHVQHDNYGDSFEVLFWISRVYIDIYFILSTWLIYIVNAVLDPVERVNRILIEKRTGTKKRPSMHFNNTIYVYTHEVLHDVSTFIEKSVMDRYCRAIGLRNE